MAEEASIPVQPKVCKVAFTGGSPCQDLTLLAPTKAS